MEAPINLPVVDISHPSPVTGQQLMEALMRHGFAYIDTRGTRFTPSVVDGLFGLSQRFFDLAPEEKGRYEIDSANRGWTGLRAERLDPARQQRGDFKEAFNIGEFVGDEAQQTMPAVLGDRQAELAEFLASCRDSCNRILELLAQGLQMTARDWFSSRHTSPSGSVLRLLHYPALREESGDSAGVDIRAGAHSDYGTITLLFQRPSQAGLEIQTWDGKWSAVPVVPDGYTPEVSDLPPGADRAGVAEQTWPSRLPPILINVGDLLCYWTNGLLPSTVHRVVLPAASSERTVEGRSDHARRTDGSDGTVDVPDRYSIVYFCHPADDTPLKAVPSPLVPQRFAAGRVGSGGGAGDDHTDRVDPVLTAKQHLQRRLEATYGFAHET